MSGVRLRRVAVVTRDRPRLALRCLESYARAARLAGRDVELAVYDDSADARARAALREQLAALARSLGVAARYAGAEEKERFAAALTRRCAAAPAAFALRGDPSASDAPTIGANRNAVMLDGAGDAVFMTDDDALCLAAPVPDREDGVRYAPGLAGFEHWFFADRQATLERCPPEPIDLLSLHEGALGRPAAELLPGEAAAGDGRAVVTLNGYLGDGAASSRSYLHLRGASRGRLLESESGFWHAVRRRESCRGVRRLTVTRGAYFMGAFAGLDLRSPLPPFPPAGRGEDGAFGALRWALRPADCAAVLPVAALHDPQPPRSYAEDELTSADLTLCDVVSGAVFAHGPSTAESLGRELASAAGGAASFDRWLRSVVEPRYRRRLEELRALLDEFSDAPAFWRAQVAEASRRWTLALEGRSFTVCDARGEEAARSYVRRFGELLLAWEELAAAARDARSSGQELSAVAA